MRYPLNNLPISTEKIKTIRTEEDGLALEEFSAIILISPSISQYNLIFFKFILDENTGTPVLLEDNNETSLFYEDNN